MELIKENCVVRQTFINDKLMKCEVLKYLGEFDGRYRFQTMNKKMNEFINIQTSLFPVNIYKTDPNREVKSKFIIL